MKEVICQFCKRKCRPDNAPGPAGYWRCDYHGGVVVKYCFAVQPGQNWHNLTLSYKTDEAKYHAVFLYDNPNYTYKFRIDRVKKGWMGLVQETAIFHLDFHPEITPENLPDKIKTYILFS